MGPRRDPSGVASTVGTLFALLVVLIYMSAVFAAADEAQKDREWELFREAQESVAGIRQAHETEYQALTIRMTRPGGAYAGSLAVPVVAGLPGTGPFQPAVAGTVYCDPVPVGTRLSFSFRAGAGTFDAVEESPGLVGIDLPTAKIPRARVLWENGALL
ncbi:MAG: hypothetical protein AABY30_01480, partial [Candidatus Thermoplasmatota archaeon]